MNLSETTRLRRSTYPMVSMSNLPKILRNNISPLDSEDVASEKAVGRVLDEDVFSDENIPPRPISMKDGYAVVTDDAVVTLVGEALPGKKVRISIFFLCQ